MLFFTASGKNHSLLCLWAVSKTGRSLLADANRQKRASEKGPPQPPPKRQKPELTEAGQAKARSQPKHGAKAKAKPKAAPAK